MEHGKNVLKVSEGVFIVDDLATDTQPGTSAMSAIEIPSPGDGSGDETGSSASWSGTSPAIVYGPDDLWLQVTGTTNNVTTMTTSFTLHLPSTNQDGVYGLYMNTNLSFTNDWTWIGRNAFHQTNLVVSGLPMDMGFFRLGPPNAIRPGFTDQVLPANDDAYTGLVDIGFPVDFSGKRRTQLYVNNNGNVTFDFFLSAYTPTPLIETSVDYETDMIAPYWGDVDTNLPEAGGGPLPVTYGRKTVNGHLAFGVDWIGVAYFNVKHDHGFNKTNSFQLVIVDRPDRAGGDYDIEFNYSQVQWETGDADTSQGLDGLGGHSARIGFASTSGANFEFSGSATNGWFLDTDPTGNPNLNALIYSHFNSTIPGRYVMQFHNGTPLALPPGSQRQLSPRARTLSLPSESEKQ